MLKRYRSLPFTIKHIYLYRDICIDRRRYNTMTTTEYNTMTTTEYNTTKTGILFNHRHHYID